MLVFLPCLPCQNKATFARKKRIKKKGLLFSKWKALKLKRSTLECCDDEDFSYIFSHTAAFIPDNFVRGTECFVFSKRLAQVFWDLKLSFALRQHMALAWRFHSQLTRLGWITNLSVPFIPPNEQYLTRALVAWTECDTNYKSNITPNKTPIG